MVFLVVMYGCESGTIKRSECRRIDAFELWSWRTLDSPLDSKEIKPVNHKRNQSWIFIGRTDAEVLKLQYYGHLIWSANSRTLILGKTDGRRRRGWQRTMVGWHHRLNGHEFEQTPGNSEGQGSLACCGSWGHKESDMTSNWTTTRSAMSVLTLLVNVTPLRFSKL